jgi:hypothetical protein
MLLSVPGNISDNLELFCQFGHPVVTQSAESPIEWPSILIVPAARIIEGEVAQQTISLNRYYVLILFIESGQCYASNNPLTREDALQLSNTILQDSRVHTEWTVPQDFDLMGSFTLTPESNHR